MPTAYAEEPDPNQRKAKDHPVDLDALFPARGTVPTEGPVITSPEEALLLWSADPDSKN